jgi:hypothetical protein
MPSLQSYHYTTEYREGKGPLDSRSYPPESERDRRVVPQGVSAANGPQAVCRGGSETHVPFHRHSRYSPFVAVLRRGGGGPRTVPRQELAETGPDEFFARDGEGLKIVRLELTE